MDPWIMILTTKQSGYKIPSFSRFFPHQVMFYFITGYKKITSSYFSNGLNPPSRFPSLEGIKQCKYSVILRDFPYSELFGLVYNSSWPLNRADFDGQWILGGCFFFLETFCFWVGDAKCKWQLSLKCGIYRYICHTSMYLAFIYPDT